jgi:hypothetical protein
MIKAQAAMEYLVTYGWVILVLAVALAVLFSIGIFSSSTYSVRAQPGSCQVTRPFGPQSQQILSLEGLCNSDLPKFVPILNGQTSQMTVPYSPSIGSTEGTSGSIFAWIKPTTGGYGIIATTSPSSSHGWQLDLGSETTSPTYLRVCIGGSCTEENTLPIPFNSWSFVGIAYGSGGTYVDYVNGVATSPIAYTISSGNANMVIGCAIGGGYCFSGNIANIQVYNTSLSANEVQQLYNEGIGGVPINLKNLVGWWPLNGDINDYSGNGNNGVPSSVSFTSGWTNGYNQFGSQSTVTTTSLTTTSTTSSTSTTSISTSSTSTTSSSSSTSSTTTLTTSSTSTSSTTTVTTSSTSTSSTSTTSTTTSTTSTSSTSTSTTSTSTTSTSTIAFSYVTGNNILTSTTSVTLSLASTYNSYMFACASGGYSITSASFTATQNGNCGSACQGATPLSSVGTQSSGSGFCSQPTNWYMSIAGVATSFTNSQANIYTATNATGGAATTLSYTVSAPNSFVAILGSCGWEDCGINSMPAGCTLKDFSSSSGQDTSFDIICASQNAGAYTVVLTTPSGTPTIASMAAYVFP